MIMPVLIFSDPRLDRSIAYKPSHRLNQLDYQQRLIITNYQSMASLQFANFSRNQVVLARLGTEHPQPAKVLSKSSYGTYKIRMYGSKDEGYACQYQLQKYDSETAQEALQGHKKNKKMAKFFKAAAKDHDEFLVKPPQQKPPEMCKQEEESLDEEGNNQQHLCKLARSRYEAILSLKVQSLVEDLKTTRETSFGFCVNDKQRLVKYDSKTLICTKLGWALEDIVLDRSSQTTEMNINEILESQVIEPIEFVTTPLMCKLQEAIDYLKKNKRAKYKNYLVTREELILKGLENYLCNYSVFLRAKRSFDSFLNKQEADNTKNICSFESSVVD